MEILVNGVQYMFATLFVLFIVVSIIEYPGLWQMLLYIALSPLWLVYKLLKYLVNGSTAVGRYILGIE